MKKTHNTSGTKEVPLALFTAVALAVLTAIPQGCSPKLYPQKTVNTEHVVTVTETLRDTIVQVQPDSSIVEALIRCDSTGRARLEEIRTLRQSARVRQTLALKDNRLTTKAVVDSMGIYLTYKDRYKEEVKVQTIETVIEKEVNILHWWQKALMWAGVLSCLTIVIMLLLKLSRRY